MSQLDSGYGSEAASERHSAAETSARVTVLSKSVLTDRRIFPEA